MFPVQTMETRSGPVRAGFDEAFTQSLCYLVEGDVHLPDAAVTRPGNIFRTQAEDNVSAGQRLVGGLESLGFPSCCTGLSTVMAVGSTVCPHSYPQPV